jgi:DNA-binding NarL/FixJ family response regulator
VRLGRAEAARDALTRLAAQVGGPFAPLAARHAHAAARADAGELAAVAAGFEDIGADLLAAEVWRSAANLLQRSGRGVPAADARRRVDTLLDRCGRPCSPALAPPGPVGEPLTEREVEVATLAARGRTSPEIAAALHVSVRTVDTHLSRVYRKLMIHGRRELAAALGLGPDT